MRLLPLVISTGREISSINQFSERQRERLAMPTGRGVNLGERALIVGQPPSGFENRHLVAVDAFLELGVALFIGGVGLLPIEFVGV